MNKLVNMHLTKTRKLFREKDKRGKNAIDCLTYF